MRGVECVSVLQRCPCEPQAEYELQFVQPAEADAEDGSGSDARKVRDVLCPLHVAIALNSALFASFPFSFELCL